MNKISKCCDGKGTYTEGTTRIKEWSHKIHSVSLPLVNRLEWKGQINVDRRSEECVQNILL